MEDSSCRKSVVLYYPHLEFILEEIEANGFERGDLLLWLGYVLSEILTLPYEERWRSKSIGEQFDNFLRGYHNVIWENTYPFITRLRAREIIKLRYLGNGSVVVILR
jgi:hypothetical protein